MSQSQPDINSLLKEDRVFAPSSAFSASAHIKSREDYDRIYKRSVEDPEGFWSEIASELHWFKKWDKVLEWDEPFAKWFVGGQTNISYNCLDRHLSTWRKNKAAIIWEGEPGDTRTLTYQQLHQEVCKFANVLKSLGIEKGDRVAIYMPMIPELPVAMLACARIGAAHSVVFGGFSAEALKDRINDAQAKAVITADGGFRRGGVVQLKPAVDEAIKGCPSIEQVVVVERCKNEIHMEPGRDHWYHQLMANASDNVKPKRSMPSICSTSSTLRARRVSRKASCTRPAAIRFKLISRRNGSSICAMTTLSGARRTSAGLRGTATSFTARCKTARRR